MVDSNEVFRENLGQLIEYSGLTDESFANIMGFSLRKLKYLKKGKGKLKIDELEKISSFFLTKKLNIKKISIDKNMRTKLLKAHEKNEEYRIPLQETPSIVYAIKVVLINADIFKQPVEVKKIKGFFEQFDWHYRSSAISMALTRMPELITICPHPTKRGTFIYFKK